MMTPIQCRMARSALRLTIKELANTLNITTFTLTYFENDKKVHQSIVNTIESWFLDTEQIQFLGKEGVFFTSKETLCKQKQRKPARLFDKQPIQIDQLMQSIRASLSKNIKRSRQKLGLTQKELASRAGIDSSYIHHIEHGLTTNPSFKVLIGIAESLEITIPELLMGNHQA